MTASTTSEDVIELTCRQLRNLGNAGQVDPGQPYLVTDYNRGTVGAATILTHGVTENTVSWDVAVQTTWDDSAWMGRWDPDTCRVIDLFDNRGNKVRSDNGDEVETFPWGNPRVYGNDFTDFDFNYTDGALVADNVGSPTGRLWVTDAGADIRNSEFNSQADVRITGPARVYRTRVSSNGRLYLVGGLMDRGVVEGYSYVNYDALEVRSSRFSATTAFYGVGAVGRVDNSTFDRAYVDLRNNGNVDLDDVSLDSYGSIYGNSGARIRLYRCSATSRGYFQTTAGATLIAQYCTAETNGYIRSATNGGTLNVTQSKVSNGSRIYHASTGSNTVQYSSATDQAFIDFFDTTTGNFVIRTSVSSYGYVRFYGTTSGSRTDRVSCRSNGYVVLRDCATTQVRYSTFDTGQGYINIQRCTGLLVDYCSFMGYGRALVQDSSGRITGLVLTSTAYLRLTGQTATGQIRYSEFNSYFYFYSTGNSSVKQGLHGSGRQTYTDPAPATAITGPGVRNWT